MRANQINRYLGNLEMIDPALKEKIYKLWHDDFLPVNTLATRFQVSEKYITRILDELWSKGPGKDGTLRPKNQFTRRGNLYGAC